MASTRGTSSSVDRKRTMTRQFKVCFCFRRMFKVKAGEIPEEVKDVFEKYSTNGTMSVEELLKFMVGFQGEREATKEDAQIIYDSVKHLSLFHRRGLHLEAFFRYLIGDYNSPLRLVYYYPHLLNGTK